MKRSFMLVLATLIASLGTLLGTSLTHPGKALADYGQGAQYQIELSYNCSKTACGPIVGSGAGLWLWIELSANNTGDYQGSDCLHGSGAIADSGSVTWAYGLNGSIVISGLILAGGHLPGTIVVPSTYGHYVLQGYPLPGFSFPGTTQLQIAP